MHRIMLMESGYSNALILYSFSPTKRCSNNTTEYGANVSGLELALQIPIANLTI